jgi:hypothetical protein
MDPGNIFAAFGLFFLKHFIMDFPLQRWPWMFQNKGTWGHPGGIVHAGLHAIATFGVLIFLTTFTMYGSGVQHMAAIKMAWLIALLLSLTEGFVHYLIDFAKMNLNRVMGWHPNTEWFWHLLGLDQLLHYMTYLLVLYIWFMR